MNLLKRIFHKTVILDANIILRYLLNDDEILSSKAHEIINSYNCKVYLEVIAEVVFVLQSKNGYNVPRIDIAEQLLLLSKDVCIDKLEVLEYAIKAYCESPKLDFVDCLLYGYHRCGKKVYTFDKKLDKKMNSI